MATYTVASIPRMFGRQVGEWNDGETMFLRCRLWRQAAERVTESLSKGARVIVHGRLKQRSFETTYGQRRTVVELDTDDIGPSLCYATAKVNKVSRGGGSVGGETGESSVVEKPPF